MVTHRDSIVSQISHIDEVILYLSYKLNNPGQNKWWKSVKYYDKSQKEDISFCYEILDKVSRSFSHIIKNLPKELSLEISVFYLICRALDTVEDDIHAFGGDMKNKAKYLKTFYRHFTPLYDVGEDLYRPLLENYDRIGNVFGLLKPESQKIIKKTVQKMGKGMSKYLHYTIDTTAQYNEYCYYVAGLVGESLTKLFSINNYETDDFKNKILKSKEIFADHGYGGLDKSMGLFLQKSNIIRDYREDVDENKQWWPKDIWRKYKPNFKDFGNDIESRNCINELVVDAMELVPDIFSYHEHIKNKHIFESCAIPQIMAIATLDKCYDNPDIFTGVVKIRKGLALKIMQSSKTMEDMYYWFHKYVTSIRNKIRDDDPNKGKMLRICNIILYIISKKYTPPLISTVTKVIIISTLMCTVLLVCLIIALYYLTPILIKKINPVSNIVMKLFKT